MMRKALTVIATLGILFSFVSCGSDDETAPLPGVDLTVYSAGEGWKVVEIDGIVCIERSWTTQTEGKAYSISCR